MDVRQQALARWATDQLKVMGVAVNGDPAELSVVSGDASFRRYFRTSRAINSGSSGDMRSFIAVDAPPEQEDSQPFVAIANAWRGCGVEVPRVYAADLQQGFMLLSDLGDDLYLPRLTAEAADGLYQPALDALVTIQQSKAPDDYELPAYDAPRLLQEMQLCPQWFFSQLLGVSLTADEQRMLDGVFEKLVNNALSQPQVCVHRDYHSRNLMVLNDGSVGVLDFQDAVIGPLSYDLVSLLRDCYISWSPEQEERWIKSYLTKAADRGVWGSDTAADYGQFKRWFDWMGLQRHIKCVGIFSRLYLRDGKAGYLPDLPRTFGYLKRVCENYPELAEFNGWLERVVVPAINRCQLIPNQAGRASA